MKLISRKIWVAEKCSNFHSVVFRPPPLLKMEFCFEKLKWCLLILPISYYRFKQWLIRYIRKRWLPIYRHQGASRPINRLTTAPHQSHQCHPIKIHSAVTMRMIFKPLLGASTPLHNIININTTLSTPNNTPTSPHSNPRCPTGTTNMGTTTPIGKLFLKFKLSQLISTTIEFSRQNDIQIFTKIDVSAGQIWLKLKFCTFENVNNWLIHIFKCAKLEF